MVSEVKYYIQLDPNKHNIGVSQSAVVQKSYWYVGYENKCLVVDLLCELQKLYGFVEILQQLSWFILI